MDTGFARVWLRLEGLAVLVVCLAAYARFGFGWGWFAVLFLAPDLSMLGYLAGAKAGAAVYNLAHSYACALAPVTVAIAFGRHGYLPGIGLIWSAHIGFDRLLGYGLKSAEGFGVTHLGRVGRERRGSGQGGQV